MRSLSRVVTALPLLLCFSHGLLAQDAAGRHPLLEDRLLVSAGLYIFDRDIKLRVDGSGSALRDFDFSESAKLSRSDSRFAGSLRWRFGEKWSVAAQYFDSSDDARAELVEDVPWGDLLFRQGTGVSAGVDIEVGRLFFGRRFSSGPRHELGLGIGAHWLEIGAFIEGRAQINDETPRQYRASVSAGAPLPNIGGWYIYAFSPRWAIETRLDWLSASFDEYSGSLWNGAAGIQYQVFEHLGFGLSYQYFLLDVDVDDTGWHGAVDLQFNGPFLSLTANW